MNSSENAWYSLAEIERIELEAWLSFFSAAPASFIDEAGLAFCRKPGYACIALKSLPAGLLNRAIGVGALGDLAAGDLDWAAAWLGKHAGPICGMDVVDAAPVGIKTWLRERKFRKQPGIMKFWRKPGGVELSTICSFDVRPVGTEAAEDFATVVQAGFEFPESRVPWLKNLPGRVGWSTYAAYDGPIPVATGAMYVHDDLAWLGFDTTLRDYRGHGAQGALLARRLNDGTGKDVKCLTVDTEAPAEGESPNSSYRNMLRVGFVEAYQRPRYLLAA
jgi:hypothetical protein